MTEIDRVFYDITYNNQYRGWCAARFRGHQWPVGWGKSVTQAVADLKHWQLQREHWAR